MADAALRFAFGRRLYRYRRYDANELRLFLTAGEIRFSNPARFNDPWDCVPRVVKQRPTTDEEWSQALQQQLDLLPLLGPRDSDQFRSMERMYTSPQYRQKAIEDLSKGQLIEGSIEQYKARIRVLCLSASGKVPLMWSHYADGHRGICLIFSTSSENGISNLFATAMAVNYHHEYPLIPFPFLTDILVRFILTKPTEWQYEDEYRLLASEENMVKSGGDRAFFPKSQNGFVGVSPTSLVGVVLGARIAPNDAEEVRGLVRSASHHVELWAAHMEPDRFALRLERLE